MTNLEKAEIIGILLHDKFQRKNNYKFLSVNEWTEEICKTINSVKVDNERAFFVMPDSDKNEIVPLEDKEIYEEILSKFEVLEKSSEKTGLPKNAELFMANFGNASPDYIRFANKDKLTVIFNADKIIDENENLAEYADRCLSDLWLGLSLLKDVAGKIETLRNRKDPASYENDKEALLQLQQICAVQANFTINNRPPNGSNHDIWNELLQNANDHIPDKGKVDISVGNDYLQLEYPDEGFSVRDFVAVCTLGNSGNEGTEKNTEGRKGTGFKSIYNLFHKVTITSNDIECVLEDSERNLSISDDGNSIKIGESISGETEKPRYYPIPAFKKAEESLKEKTRIHLTLKNEKDVCEIMKMIFGEEKPRDLCQSFIDQKAFLFLDRISEISFRVNGNETVFNREEHLEKNYWRKEQILDIEKPSHWESEKKKFEIKKTMTVLFPKKQLGEFEIDDSDKPVYCTLPVSNFSLGTPFYMNIPLLELDDSRKSLQTATASLDLKEWNVSVIQSAFKKITEIINYAVGNNLDGLNLENLYHYFPYEYLKNTEDSNLIMRKCREELTGFLCGTAFLRMTRNGYVFEACSINDIKNNNRKLLLPDYMYWWFGKCNGVNGFEYEKPFLYYDGITVDEKDQTVGAHTSIKEKLTGVLDGKPSYDFDGNKSIEEYLYNKANELSLNLEGTKDDIEKIQKALNDGNKLPFGGLLKKVFKSDPYNQIIRRTVFRAFLQYCLGESLDNKSYHCLDIDGEVVLNDYTNINSIIEQLISFFAESNSPIQFTNGEMEFIKSGFVNLVESPYVEYQRERWTDKISDKKLRLNPEQIVGKLNKNRELLAQKTRELFEDSDLVNNNVETIKEWIDRDEPVLFGNSKNGSTVGITKDIYFCCGNCSFGDFNDRVVGLDSFGETIKNVLGWRLIDTGIVEPELEFYKSIDDISFLLKILEAYKDQSEYFKEPVTEHLLSCDKGREEDFSKLFIYLLVAFKKIQWNEGFKRFIPFCKQETLDKTVLTFAENDIQSIGKGLKDRFNDIYSDDIQNKEMHVWGKDEKDDPESLSLKKMINERFYLVNDCRTGRQSLYCKAKKKNNESCIVLFTEEAFGTAIRDLYDCKGFSEPNPYVPMNCMPGNMLLGWEDYPALTDVEVEQIKEYVRNNCISSDNEEGLIEKLFSPFVFRTDKLFEIRGYGGESSDEKRCPVCDAVLLAEASSLKIKQISYRPGNKHIDLPLMLCNNCSNAFRYAKDVEWKPGNWQDELAINNVNNNEMNTASIEFSFPNGLKVKKARMSYLLRVIWWLLVEGVEEQKQE